MEGKKYIPLVFILLVFQLSKIECRDCQTVSEISGVISDYSNSNYGYEQCWNIILPENSLIRMKIHLNMRHPCERAHVQITEKEATAQHLFCSSSRDLRPFIAESSVTVTHRINPYKDHGNYNPYYSSFRLEYQINLQATAVMALSCKINLEKRYSLPSSYNLTSYYDVIEKLKHSQLSDGSFGNVYTTALITQALVASGEALKSDWNLNATFEFLMNEINSSSVDFLTTYYTLPLFNGKTLADISTINCSFNPRKQGYDIESDSRPKMRIMYSLYIGDEKDVIYTISSRVAENSTAFEVMKSVAVEDPKFRFEAKAVSGKMYVHRIGRITNDPDMGKYWLLYVGAANSTDTLTHLTT
ncbi:hypothetical protein AVEN_258886-1, partial [Araneus ventricosus]